MSVLVARHGAVAQITLDRPATRNALDAASFEGLVTALRKAGDDATVRAIVLSGAGGTFISGGDLRELRNATTREDAELLVQRGRALTGAIAEVPVPVIALLTGPAVGGGAEVAVACDLRVGEKGASFQFKQARMGVTTAWSTVARLHALVGPGHAARWLLTGQSVAVEEAERRGLVDAVTEVGAGLDHILALCNDMIEAPRSTLAELKHILRIADEDGALALRRERERFVETWLSPEHEEAVHAYFERRPPRWP